LKRRVEERLGIGLNVQHFMALTGWSQSQIAQLKEPCAEHVSLKQLKHSLSAVVFRNTDALEVFKRFCARLWSAKAGAACRRFAPLRIASEFPAALQF
jgi:hypothetical protein